MKNSLIEKDIKKAYRQLILSQKKYKSVLRKRKPLIVYNYTFKTTEDSVTLLELFKDRSELIVIHNMGKACPYCTLLADGLNGMIHHFEDRTAFVIISKDDPFTQQQFKESRNWKFQMVSAQNSNFTKDLGFEGKDGTPIPGVSILKKDAVGTIARMTYDTFGPGDLYCSLWHFFDLLPKRKTWSPKFSY